MVYQGSGLQHGQRSYLHALSLTFLVISRWLITMEIYVYGLNRRLTRASRVFLCSLLLPFLPWCLSPLYMCIVLVFFKTISVLCQGTNYHIPLFPFISLILILLFQEKPSTKSSLHHEVPTILQQITLTLLLYGVFYLISEDDRYHKWNQETVMIMNLQKFFSINREKFRNT